MNKLQQVLTNIMEACDRKRNSMGLEQRLYKCWQGGLQEIWKQLLQNFSAILLLQAMKKPSQLLLGSGLTFPDQRGNFPTRKPNCKTKRQEFLLRQGKCLKHLPHLSNGFL